MLLKPRQNADLLLIIIQTLLDAMLQRLIIVLNLECRSVIFITFKI
jgi:hypothetical protein